MEWAGELKSRLSSFRGDGVAIDTQLLLLLWIGGFDRQLVGRFKRVRKYVESDYDLLLAVVGMCPKLVTTPNVLTEVVNLAGQLPEQMAIEFREELRRVIPNWDERMFTSRERVQGESFLKLGLADSTLEGLARQNVLVLTDDFPLYGSLSDLGLPAMNFTHLRGEAYHWDL